MPLAKFKPLPETWDTALVVVAHPDDVEFGAAAAIARWTEQGKTIVYCLVTYGEAGIDAIEPERARSIREREQLLAADLVGVKTVEFLGFPDGVVEQGIPLRRAICEQVRRHRPDIVITGNFRDTWGGAMPNQADHIAVGQATIHACQDAGNRWIFTEQLFDDLDPWDDVREVWAFGSPESKHAVDTTATFERGVDSLEAHRAYITGLGDGSFDARAFLDANASIPGKRLGTQYAAAFERFTLS